ncbi:MAG: helicase-exonuclease AddAB subunit AddA [Lachnospiraceae bacterium]|nr:helicase-exonuclease AddAB subunit AddA [Lachnospiraceae bacterium]
MADRKWTNEQLNAIKTKKRRLLVSAAAGSGKTAVLVERIIQRILDQDDPVGVDELLVITFTRAAAAEMKDRIRRRLEEVIHELPREATVRLRTQLALLDSANIQTIDSFCMNVVRDHTDELDIDPNFRIAEPTELVLMQADVMEELLEECYERAEDDFIAFTDAFGEGNQGGNLEEKILRVYEFAQVTPDPEAWYQRQLEYDSIDEVKRYAYSSLVQLAASLIPAAEKILDLCHRPDGPDVYAEAIESDIEKLEELATAGDYQELSEALRNFEFKTLSRKSTAAVQAKKEEVKNLREDIKKTVRKWQEDFTQDEPDGLIKEYELTVPFIRVLVSLAREFDHRFSEKKKEKNAAGFLDVEHLALEALRMTDEYKNRFKEICVDEYQDTNQLQEDIINAIDNGNVFMVGDVKQSIYGFRQARPDIFVGKYESFAAFDKSDEGTDTLINLSRNFRSRTEVLDSVNRLFRVIMHKAAGSVEYTKDAELYPGASFGTPEEENSSAMQAETELLLVDTSQIAADDTAQSAQARMIASKITELTNPDNGVNVWDGKKYRKAQLSDIVILLRSSNVDGEVYLNTLLNAGIRAHCDTNKGYFSSLEVRTMIAMLCAIDNPRKDIELTAFLHSPVIGMTDDELVVLRKKPGKLSGIAKYKYNRGMEMLARYREMSRFMNIEDLITRIYDETGYYEYAMSLPAGKVRRANLDKLKQMASEYALTGYKGLFNFIRYIDNLKTYDTDFGEASVAGQNDDAVSIMSIHKSKGLEFPIVFIAECNKKFNVMDSNKAILIDDDLGIACRYVNLEKRYRQNTFRQMVLRMKLRSDTIGEELRILYVAMTRAREKLFLTAAINDADKFITEYTERAAASGMALADINSTNGYLNWIVKSGVNYKYTILSAGEAMHAAGGDSPGRIAEYLDSLTVDKSERERLGRVFDFEYPYAADVNLRNKISISELKKQWMIDKLREDVMTGETEIGDGDYDSVLKDEIRKRTGAESTVFDGAGGGAARGTLYHEVMEKLDYTNPSETLDSLPDEVMAGDTIKFLDSPLGQQFKTAQAEGRLYRERQFIMGIPAREIGAADSDEPVLVQGIIDAFIMSPDGRECILVDYKTDRVACDADLTARYEGQLYYYGIALEKMRDCRVTKRLIWSFCLGHEIEV